MTSKHFVAIAAAIKDARRYNPNNACARQALDIAARNLAAECAASNPNFDRARFLAACGVES